MTPLPGILYRYGNEQFRTKRSPQTDSIIERSNLRKLGFIYEFRVGKGSILVTSLNFQRFLDDGYPSVLYFFDQLLRYVTGPEFEPQQELPENQFTQLLHWVRP